MECAESAERMLRTRTHSTQISQLPSVQHCSRRQSGQAETAMTSSHRPGIDEEPRVNVANVEVGTERRVGSSMAMCGWGHEGRRCSGARRGAIRCFAVKVGAPSTIGRACPIAEDSSCVFLLRLQVRPQVFSKGIRARVALGAELNAGFLTVELRLPMNVQLL